MPDRGIADCQAAVTEGNTGQPYFAYVLAAFSTGGSSLGCNPCDGPCGPPTVLGCMVPADLVPPNPIGDLSVIATSGTSITSLSVIGQTSSTLTLRWTVPGDDGLPSTEPSGRSRYAPDPNHVGPCR